MRYIKEILKKNLLVTSGYLVIGVFNSFLLNYKADYFQKIIDGLSGGTLTIIGIVAYGIILLTGYILEYVDEYPAKKLEHGIYLDFKLLALQKISIIEYLEYVKLGTGKLVQKIENGSTAGRDVIFNFWLVLIRQLLPSILFSMYFIAKINRNIMYILMSGYLVVFVVSNVLLKVLMQMKEKVLNHEEMLNHYLIRGFMELVIFRVERQFPNEIMMALEKVNLSCLVRDSAKGLDTQIGEKGTRLSGGEKQRLALARLWFEDPELVILDEATSALDNLTEEAVMQEVLDRLKDQTMIVIAHRLNFIAAFDKIIVFRNSKITSQGTFEELMKSDPYFAELYHTSSQI